MVNLKNLKSKCNKLTTAQLSKLPKSNPLKDACRPIRTSRGLTVRWDINYERLFKNRWKKWITILKMLKPFLRSQHIVKLVVGGKI